MGRVVDITIVQAEVLTVPAAVLLVAIIIALTVPVVALLVEWLFTSHLAASIHNHLP